MARQSKLTKASRGEPCRFQIYPYCEDNPETTVPCHMPSEDKGWAIKSPDWWLVDGCSTCHAIVDGRMPVDLPEIEILRCAMRGLYRTLKNRFERGLLKEC